MLFHTQAFVLGFLPPVLVLYYLVAGSPLLRKLLLVATSVLFYALWDWRFVPLLAGLALATWIIAALHLRGYRKSLPALGVALNLGVLIWYKYTDFLGASASWLLGHTWTPLALMLPLGISFFVFQKISYLLDLRNGDRHGYSLLDFCLFVSFFPQLIAGPLVRHYELIPQLSRNPRGPAMWENLSRGAALFAIGLAKKLALADMLALIADPVFAKTTGGSLNASEAWAGAGAYALQIYFDFSGYSDMAIGLALMFGIVLPENFNAPYRATSIRDFWQRWHITLSRMLRDYLYIPLGGNRHGLARQAANVTLTMLIGGLWHGAHWTFVLWGGLHGAALAINAVWSRSGRHLPRGIGWAMTLVLVVLFWIPFRAPDFATAGNLLAAAFGLHGLGTAHLNDGWIIAVGAAVALLGPSSQQAALLRLQPQPWIAVALGGALVWLVLLSGTRLQNAFIYFQF